MVSFLLLRNDWTNSVRLFEPNLSIIYKVLPNQLRKNSCLLAQPENLKAKTCSRNIEQKKRASKKIALKNKKE